MKTVPGIVSILLSAILMVIGSLLKILHWPYANEVLRAAFPFAVIGICFFIWQAFRSKTN